MNKITYLLFVTLFVFSCKSSYTGFNALQYKALSQKPIKYKTEQLNTYSKDIDALDKHEIPQLLASTAISGADKSQIFESKLKNINTKNNFNNSIRNKSAGFIEKLTVKIIQNKVVKTIKKPTAATKPNGFESMDKNIKIGIILMATAIVLSIFGLSGVAGLAGLVGLIFLIVGLIAVSN